MLALIAEDAAVVTRPERVWRKVMQQTYAGAGSLFDAVDTFLKRPATAAVRRAALAYHDTVMSRPLAPEGSFAIGPEAMQ